MLDDTSATSSHPHDHRAICKDPHQPQPHTQAVVAIHIRLEAAADLFDLSFLELLLLVACHPLLPIAMVSVVY